MYYDICIIDYFTEEFINRNEQNCIWKNFHVKPIMARGHGQAIVEIVCHINPNVQWCYATIGSETSLDEIMNILNYLGNSHMAKVINMSFGFYEINDEYKRKYQKIIDMLSKKRIRIICATDERGIKTYPASFLGVYSVYVNKKNSVSNIEICKNNYEIFFPSISILVPWIGGRYIWVWGSSFYTAIVSGVFTRGENSDELLCNLNIRKCLGDDLLMEYGKT